MGAMPEGKSPRCLKAEGSISCSRDKMPWGRRLGLLRSVAGEAWKK